MINPWVLTPMVPGGSRWFQGDSKCKLPNTALVGLERDEWDNLSGIKTGKCCQLPPATMSKQDFSIR
jgi:hypothetical protein